MCWLMWLFVVERFGMGISGCSVVWRSMATHVEFARLQRLITAHLLFSFKKSMYCSRDSCIRLCLKVACAITQFSLIQKGSLHSAFFLISYQVYFHWAWTEIKRNNGASSPSSSRHHRHFPNLLSEVQHLLMNLNVVSIGVQTCIYR